MVLARWRDGIDSRRLSPLLRNVIAPRRLGGSTSASAGHREVADLERTAAWSGLYRAVEDTDLGCLADACHGTRLRPRLRGADCGRAQPSAGQCWHLLLDRRLGYDFLG